MKTYTLKEAAKKINSKPGIVRQWEKDFDDMLEIPRTKQGARIYTDLEIDILVEIKEMYENKVRKEGIREWMQKKLHPESEVVQEKTEVSLEVMSEPPPPITIQDAIDGHLTIQDAIDAHQFFEAMDTYKQNFLSEVKNEIQNVVRKEVLEEVKKEINKGTYTTVKSISDSIYKSSANTQAEIQDLSKTIEKASELSADSLQYLSNNIANVSIETSQEIYTLSKQLSETSEELSHYVDVTNNEISSLTEAMAKEREFFLEERNQYRHEITQREIAFQQMLNSYRDVAAAKEKKWWKFWT
ncbi:MerR family transcriptional regulator [Bacillus sp. sid0103]|uniref:MerR family transcriptional regulator n=1 Tax=Bacillus sp. sid0103 TaxID=2856337 RepID=UPI001C440B31|nr:MerR family transcriptional regulator [Bacillus sp. sid0103]MBV7506891.1 MerR family transcriptional regulator [Bacillus sp. sid0103]